MLLAEYRSPTRFEKTARVDNTHVSVVPSLSVGSSVLTRTENTGQWLTRNNEWREEQDVASAAAVPPHAPNPQKAATPAITPGVSHTYTLFVSEKARKKNPKCTACSRPAGVFQTFLKPLEASSSVSCFCVRKSTPRCSRIHSSKENLKKEK
jgi:hypothetical protein